MTTPLAPIRSIPAYPVIIRAAHCRGAAQAEAMAELRARGLWLSDEQKRMAAGSIGGGPVGEVTQ